MESELHLHLRPCLTWLLQGQGSKLLTLSQSLQMKK
jgi:hypothetical protein